MALILGLVLSYLVGAIPTAYLFGKLIKKIDIRKHGSGNVGATNAFRVLGPSIGIIVLALDTIKGIIPVVFLADFVYRQGCMALSSQLLIGWQGFICDIIILRVIFGIVSVLGHSLTIFLKFKGGKGMATTLGVLVGLCIKIAFVKYILISELLIWIVVFLLTRIVSVASIVSAIFFPLFFIVFKQPIPLVIMSLILSVFIILRHKSNVYRILHNKEPRLDLRRSK